METAKIIIEVIILIAFIRALFQINGMSRKIEKMEIQLEVLINKEQILSQENYKKKESKNIKIT